MSAIFGSSPKAAGPYNPPPSSSPFALAHASSSLPPHLSAVPAPSVSPGTAASLLQSSHPSDHPSGPSPGRPPHLAVEGHLAPRVQAYAADKNAPKNSSLTPCRDWRGEGHIETPSRCARFASPHPPPSLPQPSAGSALQTLSLTPPHQSSLSLLPPLISGATGHLRSSSGSRSQPLEGPLHTVDSKRKCLSPSADYRFSLPGVQRSSSDSNHRRYLSQPQASFSKEPVEDMGMCHRKIKGHGAEPVPIKDETASAQPGLPPQKLNTLPLLTTLPAATRPKSKRVRTGCLTCRERHLKCDENVPDCLNCRKGNRVCKRGLRLNFIDIQTKPIPYAPPATEWSVSFLDESRLIASEYRGGASRYPRTADDGPPLPAHDTKDAGHRHEAKRRCLSTDSYAQTDLVHKGYSAAPAYSTKVPDSAGRSTLMYPCDAPTPRSLNTAADGRPTGRDSVLPQQPGLTEITPQEAGMVKEEVLDEAQNGRVSDTSSIASSMVPQGDDPPSISSLATEGEGSLGRESVDVGVGVGVGVGVSGGHPCPPHDAALPEGLPTPPSERTRLLHGSGVGLGSGSVGGLEDIPSSISRCSNSGEREYLNSPDEVLYMQVFVEEVGVWMDSLDRHKHFSRVIPFLALKSPMLLNAFLACGVKHLTLVNEAYHDDKALFYYDTATVQLLRSLQNPDRDIVECATTAVVLNVYEIMSEKPKERMNHIAGARALIRECGWNARSTGIGAACFWLNIGMEVLSCLAFNWATAWDPDQWGMDVGSSQSAGDSSSDEGRSEERDGRRQESRTRPGGGGYDGSRPETNALLTSSPGASDDEEEGWVHRIFYIVAKIANFRASVPRFQEPSPVDEQMRQQNRFAEWKQLKGLCDSWNRDCPRSMRPFGYLFPSQDPSSASIFPNIWLIKRTAVIGRLFYHTAMVLLHQVNPVEPCDSDENKDAQRHHAHQVCGIVAHTKDRGVASVALRSLAISAAVLRDPREQDEVLGLLQKITAETGWRIGTIYTELQRAWARERPGSLVLQESAPPTSSPASSGFRLAPPAAIPNGMHSVGFGPGASPRLASIAPPPFKALGAPLSTSATTSPPTAMAGFPSRQLPHTGPGGMMVAAPMHRTHHMRMHSTASEAAATASATALTSTTFAATALCVQSSPTLSAPVLCRPPRAMNPLMHADFSLPDHPYKQFYRPPNDSMQTL